MGVHGLTTFIEGLQKTDKRGFYSEKIFIRSSPVIIDGCNLMYYLYFDGKAAVVGKGVKKNTADLVVTNKLPKAHLYGGDWIQYAQNVRYFFQQLKHCDITAVVIFDGAYDSSKIEVARRRFVQSVQDNVRKKSSDPHPEPGSTYTPIFLKCVFLEVLTEQKVAHYQTIGEADPTIALVAKLLGRCPILSSDSDFFIYADAVPVALKSLKFSLKQRKASSNSDQIGTTRSTKSSEKVWTLEGECISLMKICKKEFGMDDPEMLSLAAMIIGNDSIVTGYFKMIRQGDSLKKRIEGIFKWLSRQKSVESAISQLVNHVDESKRELVLSAMLVNHDMYKGEYGEKKIWQLIKEDINVSQWINSELDQKLCEQLVVENSCDFNRGRLALRFGAESNREISCVIKEQANGIDDETAKISTDDNGNVQAEMITKIVPEWYRAKHTTCELQTYLLNIFKNRIVFLPPQVEMCGDVSTHEISIPIIRITAGILLGDVNEVVRLESQWNGEFKRVIVHPIIEISKYGYLPLLKNHRDPSSGGGKGEFSKTYSHENRLSLILAALGIYDKPTTIEFYEGWPVSYRIWVATMMYYVKNTLWKLANCRDPVKRLALVAGIFLCVIKNLIVNPGKMAATPGNKCLSAISALHKVVSEDPIKLMMVRDFYQTYEDFTNINVDRSKRGYDIGISYGLSQYLCLVYHTEMLNNLLGNPLKSPKVRYTVNNFFIYNFTSNIMDKIKKTVGIVSCDDIITHSTGIPEMDEVLNEFLDACHSLGDLFQ